MTKKIDTYDEKRGQALVKEWINLALGGDVKVDADAIRDTLKHWYPGTFEVVVVDSPKAAQAEAQKHGHDKYVNPAWVSLDFDAGYGAWLEYWLGTPGALNAEAEEQAKRYVRYLRAGPWSLVALEGVAIISRRPQSVVRDEEGRLHNPDGPAVRFLDGFEVYAWRGVRVPKAWITETEKLEPKTALTWENIEQRRAAAELIGWARVLEALDAKVIQTDWSGTLMEADLPDSPGQRFVKVTCGTGRTFVLPVPSEYQTCLEAVAATYNVSPEVYSQIEGRT